MQHAPCTTGTGTTQVASIVNSEEDALQLFSPAAFPATQTGSLKQQQEEAATAATAAAAAERARYAAAQHRALLASLTSDPGAFHLFLEGCDRSQLTGEKRNV